MDVATEQLDRLIETRSTKEPDPDELEPSYMESVRRWNARRRNQNRREWVQYFDHLAHSLRARAAEYEQRSKQLLEETTNGRKRHE